MKLLLLFGIVSVISQITFGAPASDTKGANVRRASTGDIKGANGKSATVDATKGAKVKSATVSDAKGANIKRASTVDTKGANGKKAPVADTKGAKGRRTSLVSDTMTVDVEKAAPSRTPSRSPATTRPNTPTGNDGDVNRKNAFLAHKKAMDSKYRATKFAKETEAKLKTLIDGLFKFLENIFNATNHSGPIDVHSGGQAEKEFDKYFAKFKTSYKSKGGKATDADLAQLSTIMKAELKTRIDKLLEENLDHEEYFY